MSAFGFWMGWSRFLRAWHRFETSGVEHLDGGPKLIVGYHGRGVATDLFILNSVIYDRFGYLPRSIMHAYFFENAKLRSWMDELGFVAGEDAEALTSAVRAGHHIILAPGGTREANRSSLTRYEVDWGSRSGFVRLALNLGIPIVPVASTGVDEIYVGLNNGYELSKTLKLPHQVPAWLGFGPFGPAPIPGFPAKIRQKIGAPIDLGAHGPIDQRDKDRLVAISHAIQARVQALLDELRSSSTANAST